jgi:GntR family carbon starvation induced transcriptional regulator
LKNGSEGNLRSQSLVGGTLANDVLHRLREDIISCILKPGEKLRFEAMKDIYGVSFSTLREALSRLSSERLVVSEGQRGFKVAPISSEDLGDLTNARVLIEKECLLRAMERGDDEWKSRILSTFHRLDRLENELEGQRRVTPEWDQLHAEFHEALVGASASPTLAEIRDRLFERSRRYRRISAMVRKTPRAKTDEHRMIMEAVLSNDVDHAMTLIERHVREIAQNIMENGLEVAPVQAA